jgi:glycerol-3-phosphate dehydrogenase
MYDIVIIGAGIAGTMLAKDLSQYQLKVAVVEKDHDTADETTMANSAIVHTGYDPEDGTLKAKLNVAGARMYPQLCRDLGCKYKVVGAYIAACGEEEEKHLDVLADRADRRGIPYEWLSGDEARKAEPNLSDHVTKVLNFYTTGIIYPWEVANACMETAVNNGVELYLDHEVTGIDHDETGYTVYTADRDFKTEFVINASGISADKIAGMAEKDPGFRIKPRKGEYFVIDHDVKVVDHIIFPVPGPSGKGVLAIPTVFGNTLIGPNSTYTQGDPDKGTTSEGMDLVRQNIAKTMKNIPWGKVIRTFAGLRPSSTDSDFIIREGAEKFIDIAGYESPGLASAPGMSQYVIETFIAPKKELKKNPDAKMTRKRPVVMEELSPEERDAEIRKNPLYAKIICRCEQISEQEIIDCIHSPVGARSVKGVKKRVRPGMGRCQGGFCEPRVVGILARELGCSPLDVVLDSPASKILEKENR